ncbi:MAG: hypothetical protein VKP70_08915 [Cyanobacteriota bacterium]|nr:hypothetical protein [Cyanobacteriota bacterium]
MANEPAPRNPFPERNGIAIGILVVSALVIAVLAGVAIRADTTNALTIFNITLPVIASWVGTVLAFYFGRENFEAANSQMRQLINKLTPEERALAPISEIMRAISDTTRYQLESADQATRLELKILREKFSDSTTRLPVIGPDFTPRFLIHASKIDKYLAEGGKETDTLQAFIDQMSNDNLAFDAGRGFVLVATTDTIATAKARLEASPSCQDIFITKDGKSDQPLLGWVSNIRLSKYLQA